MTDATSVYNAFQQEFQQGGPNLQFRVLSHKSYGNVKYKDFLSHAVVRHDPTFTEGQPTSDGTITAHAHLEDIFQLTIQYNQDGSGTKYLYLYDDRYRKSVLEVKMD